MVKILTSDRKEENECNVVISYWWSMVRVGECPPVITLCPLAWRQPSFYHFIVLFYFCNHFTFAIDVLFSFFLSMAQAIILPKLMFYSRVFNIQTCNMPQILQKCLCKTIGFFSKNSAGNRVACLFMASSLSRRRNPDSDRFKS